MDRVAVVAPGARVDDHAVGPVERVVAELDVLALAVRLAAADGVAELAGPRVDALLELVQRKAAVDRRVAPVEDVEVHAVEDVHAHGGSLVGDQLVERAPHVGLGNLGHEPALVARAERAGAAALLVAEQRVPGALAVDAHRLGCEDLLDDIGRSTREA